MDISTSQTRAYLENCQPYMGSDHMMLGYGRFVPIINIGFTILHTGKYALSLKHLLHIPSLAKTLISIK